MTKPLSKYSAAEIKQAVANRYGQVANKPDRNFNFPIGRRFAECVGYDVAVLDRLPLDWSIVFTNNASEDGSLDEMRRLREADPRIKIITLSRDFGYHAALLAGEPHAAEQHNQAPVKQAGWPIPYLDALFHVQPRAANSAKNAV